MLSQFEEKCIMVFCQNGVKIIETLRKYVALIVSIHKQGQQSFFLCDSDILFFFNKHNVQFVQRMIH
jgi:hypothetical protein